MRKRVWWFAALALIMSAWPVPLAAHAASAPAQERALFVDAFGPGLEDADQIDQLVADAKAAHINTLIVQVVRRGDCWCNQSLLPRTEAAIAPAPFDPLATVITRAHAAGIAVDAWISTLGAWKGAAPPHAADHVYNTHGPSATGANNWLMWRVDGRQHDGDETLLDPGNPAAAAYVVQAALSIVANYDVDGLNLDRIRYPDDAYGASAPVWGYNPVAVARFQAATGRTDTPAPTDAQWTAWRREQVTNLVRRISLDVAALKPSVQISVDAIAYGYGPQHVGGWQRTAAYAQVLQDWQSWLQAGIIDVAIPMVYRNDASPAERRMFDEWVAYTRDHQGRGRIVMGAGLYMNDAAGNLAQLQRALAPDATGNSLAGWAGYAYRTPDAAVDAGKEAAAAGRAALLPRLVGNATAPGPFAVAAAPLAKALGTPTTGLLRGVALGPDGAPLDQATVTLRDASGRLVASWRTDGSGWFGAADLPAGRYRLQLAAPTATADVVIVPGRAQTVLLPNGPLAAFALAPAPEGVRLAPGAATGTLTAQAVGE